MASYQDIDTRLKVIEDKVDFLLRSFTVTRQERSVLDPSKVIVQTQTLADVYREIKTTGLVVTPFGAVPASEKVENGTDSDNPAC